MHDTELWGKLLALRQRRWYRTVQRLYERVRQDRLSLSASSLAFTTTLTIVPLLAVALAIFSTHPLFLDLQKVLQKWLIDSLVPDAMSKQVMSALTQFTSKAHRVGFVGFAALVVSTLVLVLTIDRTLNNIWRVPVRRPIWKRVLVYSLLLSLGPLLLATSLWLTTQAVMWSKGLLDMNAIRIFYNSLEFVLVWVGLTCLYRYVPNTLVRWQHAWAGAFFAALTLEGAKKLLTLYLVGVPSYSIIYGAFATVPLLLLWIYVAWLIVLLGAQTAASWAEFTQ